PRQDSRTSRDALRATDAQSRSWLLRALGFPVAERQGYLLRVAVAASLIAVIAFAVWLRAKPIPRDHSETTTSSTEPATLDPQLEWNATQSELDSTAAAIEQLDADAQRDLE
ncbi:MAG: hypothetical protein FD138_3423, partial [Planctomycetota bacterium]